MTDETLITSTDERGVMTLTSPDGQADHRDAPRGGGGHGLFNGDGLRFPYRVAERLAAQLGMECRNMIRARLTEDAKEAMQAFLEKREPRGQGLAAIFERG